MPEPTTVAAKSQKQVALLGKDAVPVSIVYESKVFSHQVAELQILVRAVNRADKGLGLPLPAGPVALFERQGQHALLIGESATDDKAVGEEVEVKFPIAANVTVEARDIASKGRERTRELVVSNANPFAIRYEADFNLNGEVKAPTRLGSKNGRKLWAAVVPANGTATLRYREIAPR